MRPAFLETTQADPLDLEIEPGFRVRDLNTVEECAAALIKLDMEIEKIISQIGRSETNPGDRPKGWRTRAQSAIRWKKRVRSAVLSYRTMLTPTRPPARSQVNDKRQAILDTIQREIGDAEFERLVQIAKDRNPDLNWSNP